MINGLREGGTLASAAAGQPTPERPSATRSSATRRSLPRAFMLTQPDVGPRPETSSYSKRTPSTCFAHTTAPVSSRAASKVEDKSLPSRTKMPPASTPPTTFQWCPLCCSSLHSNHSSDTQGRATCAGSVGTGGSPLSSLAVPLSSAVPLSLIASSGLGGSACGLTSIHRPLLGVATTSCTCLLLSVAALSCSSFETASGNAMITPAGLGEWPMVWLPHATPHS
mmetsp:Transcript_58374/g.136462  ORF Transcript_58374/g.136462 Transcript_58374/m.136462 type:complete len:224 (+) Transcript_58374:686-1357(+)